MAALLLLYAAHPVAGWTTFLALLLMTVGCVWRKAKPFDAQTCESKR